MTLYACYVCLKFRDQIDPYILNWPTDDDALQNRQRRVVPQR
jgi:hypothetical protein